MQICEPPPPAEPDQCLEKLIERVEHCLAGNEHDGALVACRELLSLYPSNDKAHILMAQAMMPGENYIRLLSRIHRHLEPATYVEIGVASGASLAVAGESTRSIGIDPYPRVKSKIQSQAKLYPTESDAFFDHYDLFDELGLASLDLAFIDGLHLFEQALRDFINLERYAEPHTVIAIHDCFPPTELCAERERALTYWVGDVWRLVPCLIRYRPDLNVCVVPALPSGVGIVTGLNRDSGTLAACYDDIVAEALSMPYGQMDANRDTVLQTIPNDWNAVADRLKPAG